MLRRGPRFKICERSNGRAAIPRTHVLANIAAEDMPPHRLAELPWNCAAQLNREIRDAAPRIQNVGLDDGSARASVNAQTAIPAKILRRSARWAERLRQIERRHDHAKEKPRTRCFVDETSIL